MISFVFLPNNCLIPIPAVPIVFLYLAPLYLRKNNSSVSERLFTVTEVAPFSSCFLLKVSISNACLRKTGDYPTLLSANFSNFITLHYYNYAVLLILVFIKFTIIL